MPERHLRAAQTHDDMAQRHEEAALHWDEYDEPEHAELERRNAEIERAAAQLERAVPISNVASVLHLRRSSRSAIQPQSPRATSLAAGAANWRQSALRASA